MYERTEAEITAYHTLLRVVIQVEILSDVERVNLRDRIALEQHRDPDSANTAALALVDAVVKAEREAR